VLTISVRATSIGSSSRKERVMRYGSQHKEATRLRILSAAGRRIRRDGIDGSGVARLMSDAGLTNGAFYAHFDSKEDLVAQVVADQLQAQLARLGDLEPGPAGVAQFLAWYVSAEHRDAPADGCPSAALLDEIARSSDVVRAAYTKGLLALADEVAGRLAPQDPGSVRGAVLGAFATLIGTVQLARAVTDASISDAILQEGAVQAIAALGLAANGGALPPVEHRR
jgi:TetR/AcrR family transcriptional regulator, transcriptional repressor for nem operon